LAEAEVSAPSREIAGLFLDDLREAFAAGPARRFPHSRLEPCERVRREMCAKCLSRISLMAVWAGIGGIEKLEEFDELAAAMAILDQGMDPSPTPTQ
jgi:hypothetical protein